MLFARLQSAIAADAAIRRRRRLQPAGGPGDKIFPPTYPGEGARNPPPRHVFEIRREPTGGGVACVLIDSVQSQANRLEESLREAIAEGVRIPHVSVDFGGSGIDFPPITSLDAPHRLFDAILRDSAHEGVPFMQSPSGIAIATATSADASAILRLSPTALIFGVWNSTGEGGGLGAKFARVLTSEIVGFNVPVEEITQRGETEIRTSARRTGSRIDPLGILRKVDVYKTKSGWDTDQQRLADRSKNDKPKKVRPSEINHGNIAPSVQALGVTMEYAEHVVVLSLAGLRRARFGRAEWNASARSYLAALALLAIVEQDAMGYALRSRCDLVPDGHAPFEIVRSDGSAESFDLDRDTARALYTEAKDAAAAAGIEFVPEPLVLKPQQKLVDIIKRSRELALQGEGGEESIDADA